jgi:hypothetical protein
MFSNAYGSILELQFPKITTYTARNLIISATKLVIFVDHVHTRLSKLFVRVVKPYRAHPLVSLLSNCSSTILCSKTAGNPFYFYSCEYTHIREKRALIPPNSCSTIFKKLCEVSLNLWFWNCLNNTAEFLQLQIIYITCTWRI